jgi:hypothetical protein
VGRFDTETGTIRHPTHSLYGAMQYDGANNVTSNIQIQMRKSCRVFP